MAQSPVTITEAGSYQRIVAPGSLAVAFGSGFSPVFVGANATLSNSMYTLPTTVGGDTVTVTDSGTAANTSFLYMVSPDQINLVIPSNAALGAGTVSVQTANGALTGPVLVSNVSPAIMTADGTINGAAAATLTVSNAAGQSTTTSLVGGAGPVSQPAAISLMQPAGSSEYLTFYGTGIRNHSLNPVIAQINGVTVPVTYAGPQNQYPGTDVVTVGPLPSTLAGAGVVNVAITVDGVPANVVKVAFQ
ncbi:MAG TPA: hypothetical protein VHW09_01625 [Bryobacteraceae bacterium]|nr:hypothetical protein [Bryobacteraceae bacterium]